MLKSKQLVRYQTPHVERFTFGNELVFGKPDPIQNPNPIFTLPILFYLYLLLLIKIIKIKRNSTFERSGTGSWIALLRTLLWYPMRQIRTVLTALHFSTRLFWQNLLTSSNVSLYKLLSYFPS